MPKRRTPCKWARNSLLNWRYLIHSDREVLDGSEGKQREAKGSKTKMDLARHEDSQNLADRLPQASVSVKRVAIFLYLLNDVGGVQYTIEGARYDFEPGIDQFQRSKVWVDLEMQQVLFGPCRNSQILAEMLITAVDINEHT